MFEELEARADFLVNTNYTSSALHTNGKLTESETGWGLKQNSYKRIHTDLNTDWVAQLFLYLPL